MHGKTARRIEEILLFRRQCARLSRALVVACR
jgi:hypothetical protein